MNQQAPVPRHRAACVILGCRRTFPRTHHEHMCRDHYRLADRGLRKLRQKLAARARRQGWTPRLEALDHWLWVRIKRQAQQRARGL